VRVWPALAGDYDYFRFTAKGNTIYAIEMAWPPNSEAFVNTLGTALQTGKRISSVVLLGSNANLQFHQEPNGLRIQLPVQAPGKYAYVFRILLQD
jgi:alpha-L-fucosidase